MLTTINGSTAGHMPERYVIEWSYICINLQNQTITDFVNTTTTTTTTTTTSTTTTSTTTTSTTTTSTPESTTTDPTRCSQVSQDALLASYSCDGGARHYGVTKAKVDWEQCLLVCR